ncbi:bis(5'-adenosyl)-triphosphatase enpp4-like, partial [Argonauta hians]
MQLRSSMLRLQLLWFLSLLLMCILIVQPPCISARPRARARAAARTHAADINLARAAVAATTTNITTTTTTTTTTTRTTTTTNTKSNNKILIILLDGFRWDYFDRPGLTGYQNFLRKGSRAEYLKNSFPTISYPNYYTIMTGLYSNKHGFIGNTMYDPKHDTNFMGTGSYAQYAPYWWDDGDPLWITAKRQNKTSYFYHWPGCEVTIKNLEPDFCRRYTGLPSMNDFKDSIRQGLNNLVNNSADLVGIYFELTDKVGHNYGPNSPEIDQILKTSSKIIDDLLIQIEKLHLEDSVNVVLTSDHGMSEITSDRIISLTYVVDRSDLYYIYGRTFVAFWPVEGKLDKVYKALKNYHPNFTVYLKKDIPERWHLKEHYRVPPLIGVADPGWYVLHPHDIFPGFRGYHGYDNDDADMRGV